MDPQLGRPDIKDPPPSYSKAGYTTLPQSEPAYYGGQSEAAYQYGPSSTDYTPPAPPVGPFGPGGAYYTPGYAGYPQSAGYAPAPPVMQQSSINTNVVVVGQPSAPAQTTIVHAPRRANEYLALTLVLCVLCFLHGNLLAVLLLIPALICSCVASDHNNAGNYSGAKQCGELALCCNICVIIKYILLVIAAIIIGILFAVGVLTVADFISSHCSQQCDFYGTNCHKVCN